MPRRDRRHNSTSHHFVGDFASGPLTDGPFFRLLAGHRHDLACLLCGDLRRPSWTWDIGEPFAHWEVLQRQPLQSNPSHPPTANRIHAHCQFSGDLRVSFPVCCCQDHASSFGQLLWSTMSSDKLLQVFALFSAYRQLRWFRPFLHLFSSSLFPPILPHTYFSRNVLAGRATSQHYKAIVAKIYQRCVGGCVNASTSTTPTKTPTMKMRAMVSKLI